MLPSLIKIDWPGNARELKSAIDRLALAKSLPADSGNNLTLVAARLGINPATHWRWRKAGKV